MSQAFNYQGEGLLGQDKCGEAIRSLKESEKGKDRRDSRRLLRRKVWLKKRDSRDDKRGRRAVKVA